MPCVASRQSSWTASRSCRSAPTRASSQVRSETSHTNRNCVVEAQRRGACLTSRDPPCLGDDRQRDLHLGLPDRGERLHHRRARPGQPFSTTSLSLLQLLKAVSIRSPPPPSPQLQLLKTRLHGAWLCGWWTQVVVSVGLARPNHMVFADFIQVPDQNTWPPSVRCQFVSSLFHAVLNLPTHITWFSRDSIPVLVSPTSVTLYNTTFRGPRHVTRSLSPSRLSACPLDSCFSTCWWPRRRRPSTCSPSPSGTRMAGLSVQITAPDV